MAWELMGEDCFFAASILVIGIKLGIRAGNSSLRLVQYGTLATSMQLAMDLRVKLQALVITIQ